MSLRASTRVGSGGDEAGRGNVKFVLRSVLVTAMEGETERDRERKSTV